MSSKDLIHDLRKDIHNVFTLLRFIKDENSIHDDELKEMLLMNLSKFPKIEETLKNLNSISKKAENEL